jgi:hypothetical protein
MNRSKKKVSKPERIIRVILGVLLIGTVFSAPQHPIGWIGVIVVLTGIGRICLLYSVLGINTKPAAERVGLTQFTGHNPLTRRTKSWTYKA